MREAHPGRSSRQPVGGQRGAGLRDQRRHPVAGEADHPVALVSVLEQEHGRDGVGIQSRRELEVVVELGGARQRQPRDLLGRLLGVDWETSLTPAASSAGSTWSQTGQSCLTIASTDRAMARFYGAGG